MDAYKRKGAAMIDKTPMYYINFSDLVKDKEATGRDKDIRDIRELRKIWEDN